MNDIDTNMLEEFINEAKDHLESVENDILSLESMSDNVDIKIVNQLFRAMHSVKGGSGFLNLTNVTKLAHSLENIFDNIRNHKIIPNETITESLLKSMDKLKILIENVDDQADYDISQEISDLEQLNTSPILEHQKSQSEKNEKKEENQSSKAQNIVKKISTDSTTIDQNSSKTIIKKEKPPGFLYIYNCKIDLIKECDKKKRLPEDLIKNIRMLGTIIDDNFPLNDIGTIDDAFDESFIFTFTLSTIIDDRALIADTLEIDPLVLELIKTEISNDENDEKSSNTDKIKPEVRNVIPENTSVNKIKPKIEETQTGKKIEKPIKNDQNDEKETKKTEKTIPSDQILEKLKTFTPHNPELSKIKKTKASSLNKQHQKLKKMDNTKVKISMSLLEKLMNLASELVLVRNQNTQAVESKDYNKLLDIAKRLNVVTTGLQTGILQTRMQPVDMIFSKFNRIIRDLSKQLGKEINVTIESNNVELDKNIIESLQDPLTHLIRNAIDHGIESPEIREQNGKNPIGQILIAAYHNAGYVNIRITDDGKGMDANKLISAAVDKGILTQKEAETYPPQDAFNLIFYPGFSTVTEISEISGRGVGMNVVKSNLQNIGGVINISSTIGYGTTIDINLPLTLSIMQALIVLVEDICFAIPEFNISEVVKLYGEEVYSKINLVNEQELFSLRGKLIPLIRLGNVLKLTKTYKNIETGEVLTDRRAPVSATKNDRRTSLENYLYILIIKLGSIQFGLVVDDIIDTEEIVIKSLHDQLKKIKIFIGTTILGDGRIATIVDIGNLAELATFNINKVESQKEDKKEVNDDKQVVLTFNICGKETFAIPLFLISHIEKINNKNIMVANQKEYFKYQNEVIQLIRIENALDKIDAHYLDEVFVIIIKGIKPIGIVVSQLIDTILISSNIDTKTIMKSGIIGDIVVNEELILILDIFAIINIVEPTWLHHSLNVDKNRKKKVLLLDDMKFYTSLLMSYFAGTGMDVSVASNGQEGVNLINTQNFDLIISDLEMPVMDGFQFAKYIRSNPSYDHIKMVAISSIYDRKAGQEIVKEAGFDSYIDKRNREDFLRCLKEITK